MCEYVNLGDGNFAIVCGGHPRRALCAFCGRKPHTKLCDAPVESGTCDAKICDDCATPDGINRDLCPYHRGHMKFPVKREQLQRAGYVFEFARPCKRCNADLEFFRTPSGKLAPMELLLVDGAWLMDSHFKSCPFADDFRKPGAGDPPKPKQGDLF